MHVSTHPKELTGKAVKKWVKEFKTKLKRTTSRNDLDRLILSVERRDFEERNLGQWEEVTFTNEKGKVCDDVFSEEWAINSLQKAILDKNTELEGRTIRRSELQEETGEWILDKSLQKKVISAGGEAIVLEEKFGELDVAVRVQCFDSAMFVEEYKDEFEFEIHLSEGNLFSKNSFF